MTTLTMEVCEPFGVKPRDAERSKNFFALGLVSWMYTRPVEPTDGMDRRRSSRRTSRSPPPTRPRSVPGSTSARPPKRSVTATKFGPASLPPGEYTSVTGNTALAWGLIAAGQSASFRSRSGRTRSRRRRTSSTSWRSTSSSASARCRPRTRSLRSGVALGAAFAGHLGVTTTSGPGVALKSETDLAGCRDRVAVVHRRHPAAAGRRPVCPRRPRRPT